MSDVTWLTIERAEELFFVSKTEIDSLIESGKIDHKFDDLDGRRLKLVMLHQLAREFDGRDTRARLTNQDMKDVLKGATSNVVYKTAGVVLATAGQALWKQHRNEVHNFGALSDQEIAEISRALDRAERDGTKIRIIGFNHFIEWLRIEDDELLEQAQTSRVALMYAQGSEPVTAGTAVHLIEGLQVLSLNQGLSMDAHMQGPEPHRFYLAISFEKPGLQDRQVEVTFLDQQTLLGIGTRLRVR